jgi:hypothetical protein
MNKLKNFFWFCSGANTALLMRCPTEHVKYAGIGATVFFTGLFAMLSGTYAIYFIFNDAGSTARIAASVIFGLVWGAMIFNLDRYIVSSMKKRGSFWSEFRVAAPRLMLATIIAFVISKPLELQIFHTSIEYEMELMKQAELLQQENALTSRFDKEIKVLEADVKSLQNEIETKTTVRNNLAFDARTEADGTGGSFKRGAATIYKIKKADADNAQKELDLVTAKNNPLIAAAQTQLTDKRKTVDSLKAGVKRGEYDGFDKRLDALGNVTVKSKTIATSSWFIMLLFLAIETAPVIVKLMSSKGPYDDLLEQHEHAVENHKIEQMSIRNQKTNEKLQVLVETGSAAVTEEIESNKELTKHIVKAEAEIAQEMIAKWKADELEKIKSGNHTMSS